MMLAIARKEFIHILRDRGTFLLVTIGPLFLMVIFTYTLTTDVKEAPLAVIDLAHNDASTALIDRLDASPKIHVERHLASADETDNLFKRGEVVAAVVIPADYGQVSLTRVPQVEAIIDGTEPISAETVLTEVYQIADAHSRELAGDALQSDLFEPPIYTTQERLYNDALSSKVDFYPGLMGMMLGLPAIALSLSLARERENGTLEQLMATPIAKRALLLGKLWPYLGFGMVDVYALLALGQWVYDVPFTGNLLAYSLIAFLFMFASLGMGLVVSVIARTQQVAVVIAILVFFIPPFFMSGTFFPVDAMPQLVQLEMMSLPATHFVTAGKAIYLQGTALRELWLQVVLLTVISVEMLEVSTFIFRKKVVGGFRRPAPPVLTTKENALS
ncbi:MAG: ABC transporter permease [Anaerolineales bacterium]|nr:ABC transporter permease [Anaerolineales bacterium]